MCGVENMEAHRQNKVSSRKSNFQHFVSASVVKNIIQLEMDHTRKMRKSSLPDSAADAVDNQRFLESICSGRLETLPLNGLFCIYDALLFNI
jgi:hypothetical protein